MRRQRPEFGLKLISSIIIIFLTVFFIIGYLDRILRNSEYFKIKDIVAKGVDSIDLSNFKGRNIFMLNLQEESNRLSALYPTYKRIRLIKVLPNRLFVDFISRKPLGIVKLYRYFCVDEDAALFDVPAQLQELDLPLILGLDTKIFGPKPGRIYNIKELNLALDIIKEVDKNRNLKDYKIKIIDVANLTNASFFLNEGLEIKLGGDDIRNKINILSSLLIQIKSEQRNIKYIDLRFKEPVIKFKNVQ